MVLEPPGSVRKLQMALQAKAKAPLQPQRLRRLLKRKFRWPLDCHRGRKRKKGLDLKAIQELAERLFVR